MSFILLTLTACTKQTETVEPKADAKTETKAEADKPDNPNLLMLAADSVNYAKLQFAEVAEASLAAPLDVTGRVTINEDRTVRIGAAFEGRVLQVMANVGDRVRKGQILARVHTHEVHEAEADYAQARVELDRKKSQAAFAKSLLERAERLFQAKAGSQHELDKARVEYQAAQQEVAHAEAEVERAKGHLEYLELPEDKRDYDAPVYVRASTAGVVMKRQVSPGTSINLGEDLFFISDLSSVWVIAEVPEKHLSLVRVGASVQVKVAAWPDDPFIGRIVRTGEMLNADTRTIEVRCLVDNRLGRLKPEMYATISLATNEKRSALLVAAAAIQEMDGQTVVFLARDNNQFEKRVVKVGRKQGAQVEILEGLSSGDRVVTEGGFLLKSEFSKDKLAEDE